MPTPHFLVEQRMIRSTSTAASWLAVCLAALGGYSHCLAVEPASATSIPVRGEMVDADAPAAYRLPVVGIFGPPKDRLAMRSDEVQSKSTRQPAADETASGTASGQAPAALAAATKSELTNQLLPAVKRGYNLAQ